jgi:hypothetical protein
MFHLCYLGSWAATAKLEHFGAYLRVVNFYLNLTLHCELKRVRDQVHEHLLHSELI